MALIPKNDYVGRVDETDPNFPQGKAQNLIGAVVGTGTPTEANWVNDIWGFQQAILTEAGITPSGAADNANSSQYLEGLDKRVINDLSQAYAFDTVLLMTDSTIIFPVGKTLETKGYTTKGDGGGGKFLIESGDFTSEVAADVVKAVYVSLADDLTGATKVAKRQYEGALNIRWGGAGQGGDDVQIIGSLDIDAQGYGEDLYLPRGTYEIPSAITIVSNLIIDNGANINVTGGSGQPLIITGKISAGEYQIITTTDVFVTSNATRILNTSCKIAAQQVKAEWLGVVKVVDIDDIKTIPDQTGNLLKAFRATTGNFISDASDFITEYSESRLKLGTGYYRVDQEFDTGYSEGGSFYRQSGGGIVADGPSSSFLVRTDLASTARVLSIRYYTGELTVCENFKVTAYDPDAVAKFSSASTAMIWCQGDSLFKKDVWASGAQVTITDANGIERNGVGIQYESCVDTFGSNVFVELCATNYAFSSSVVNLVNITSFGCFEHNFGIGNFSDEWPDTQTTGNTVSIVNSDTHSMHGNYVEVLSGGNNKLSIKGGRCSGAETGTGNAVGVYLVHGNPSSRITGCIDSIHADKMSGALIYGEIGSVIGDYDLSFSCINGSISDIVNVNPMTRGAVTTNLCTTANVLVSNYTFKTCERVFAKTGGRAVFEDITLVDFVGRSDGGASRQLGVISSGQCFMSRIYRDPTDVTALTLYATTGASAYVRLDLEDLPNATRAVGGSGTAEMPSITAFV